MSETRFVDPTTIDPAGPTGPTGLAGVVTERLEAEITTLAAHLTAAMCRWLLLVGEYDRRRAYEQWECGSMANWLNVHVGISPSTARQHVAVARKLGELPMIRAAFSRGELSFSRIRAICRAATPSDEPRWIELATHATATQIERIVRDTIRVTNAAKPGQEQLHIEQRRVSWWIDHNGMYHLTAVLPPETGALLVKLIKTETVTGPASTDDYEQRHADALTTVLHHAATSMTNSNTTGTTVTGTGLGSDSAETPRPPVLIVVHRYPNGTAHIENGPPIPPSTAERLAHDTDEIVATHTEAEIRYSRKRKRVPTTPMRRYLQQRDHTCRFPGCAQTQNLHAHHIKHYSHNGETTPDNLVMLCPRHHGAIHNRGWTLTGTPDTTITFHNPTGQTFSATTTHPDRHGIPDRHGNPDHITTTNHLHNIKPTPVTIMPKGHGETYDHELTIWTITNFPYLPAPPPPPHPNPH